MLEVEAKFFIPSEKVFRALLAQDRIGAFTLRSPRKELVTDTYYDSPEGLLAASGCGCRVRVVGGKSVLTLKQPGKVATGVHAREELESSLPKSKRSPAAWPKSPVKMAIEAIVETDRLVEICRVRQTRHKRLAGIGRRVPLEWSMDRVVASSPDKETRFLELEIEIRPSGRQEDLNEFLEAFDSDGLTALGTNKLERILRALHPKMNPEKFGVRTKKSKTVQLEDPIRTAAVKVLQRLYRKVLKREKETRLGKDIEELHQMRTSVRRLRSGLDLFLPILCTKSGERARRSSKKLGQALGHVRDLDVALEKLERYRVSHEEEFASFDPLHRLHERIEKQRAKERKRLVSFLEGPRYEQFQEDLERLLKKNLMTHKQDQEVNPPLRVSDAFPVYLWEAYARILRFESVAEEPTLEALHQLRIECKNLRYLVEYFRKVCGENAGPVLQRIKHAQEELGEIQDARVTHDLLENFLADLKKFRVPKKERDPVTEAVRLYEQRNSEHQAEVLARFPKLWAELTGPEFRGDLQCLVDQIQSEVNRPS